MKTHVRGPKPLPTVLAPTSATSPMAFRKRRAGTGARKTRAVAEEGADEGGQIQSGCRLSDDGSADGGSRGPMSFEHTELGARCERNKGSRPLKLGKDKIPMNTPSSEDQPAPPGTSDTVYSTEALKTLQEQQQSIPESFLHGGVHSRTAEEASEGFAYERNHAEGSLLDSDALGHDVDAGASETTSGASARRSRLAQRQPKAASEGELGPAMAEEAVEDDEGRMAFDPSRLLAGQKPEEQHGVTSIALDSDDEDGDDVLRRRKQQTDENHQSVEEDGHTRSQDTGTSTYDPHAAVESALSHARSLERRAEEEDDARTRASNGAEASRKRLEQLRSDFSERESVLGMVRNAQEYMSVLCDCLAEKAPQVEALEDSVAKAERALAAAESQGESDCKQREDELRRELERAERESKRIFEDVSEQYASIEALQAVLSAWKRKGGSTYSDSYAHECAPMLYAPFVRAEMAHSYLPLQRNHANARGLQQMQWTRDLEQHDEETGDAAKVRVLEAIAVPRVRAAIEEALDVRMEGQRESVESSVRELEAEMGSHNEQLADLTSVLRKRVSREANE